MTTPFTRDHLNAFRAAHRLGGWTPAIVALAGKRPLAPSRQVLEHLREDVATEAARTPMRWGRIHDLVALFAVLTDGGVVDEYAVMQALAPSHVGRSSLRGLLELYQRLETTLGRLLPDAVGLRLRSFASVAELFLALVPARQSYEAKVRSLSSSNLALVLAVPGLTFLHIMLDPEGFVLRRLAWQPEEATPESLSTGASYTLTTFNRIVGFKSRFVSAVVGSAPPPEPTYELIGRATTLFSMDEAEVDVFRAGYTCERDNGGAWVVAAPNETIARAFELGHVDTMWQDILRQRASSTRDPHTVVHLGDVAKEFARTLGETLFRIVPGPPRRVRLEMPAQVANHIGLALIVKDDLYAEEFEWIGATCYELVALPRELESVRIGTHITLWDVLLISRVFRLLMVGWLDAMERLGDDVSAKLNSSIQVGPPSAMLDLICAFGFNRDKVYTRPLTEAPEAAS